MARGRSSETRADRLCAPTQLCYLLEYAIRRGNQDVVDLIVKHEAPLGPSKRSERYCLLADALESGCEAILEYLLQVGVQPAPHRLDILIESAAERKDNSLLLLLKLGFRPQSTWALGNLVHNNSIASLQLLTDFRVEIAVYGHVLLFPAIFSGHQTMIEFLTQQVANPRVSCARIPGENYSLVRCAVQWRNFQILELLLARGVRPDYKDLELAITMDLPDVVTMLESFSYEDVPERMTLEDSTQQREAERIGGPNFYQMMCEFWNGGMGSLMFEGPVSQHHSRVFKYMRKTELPN